MEDKTEMATNTTLTDGLMSKVRAALVGKNAERFFTNFSLHLQQGMSDPNAFIIDLGTVCEYTGQRRDQATKTMESHFIEDSDYQKSFTSLYGKPECQILMTVDTFKTLSMISSSKEGREARDYYITMERILFQHTQDVIQHTQDVILEQSELIRDQVDKIARTTTKVYSNDNVYIFKERAELATDAHKIGKAVGPKLRLAKLKTGSAQGIIELFRWSTHNAKLIEDIMKCTMKRTRYTSREGGSALYDHNVGHSARHIAVASTFVDFLASTNEIMPNKDFFAKIHESIWRVEEQLQTLTVL